MTDQVIIQQENYGGQRIPAGSDYFADITTVPYIDAVWVDAGLKFIFDGTLTDDEKQAVRMRVKTADPAHQALLVQAQTGKAVNDAFLAKYPTAPTMGVDAATDAQIHTDFHNQVIELTKQASGFVDLNTPSDIVLSPDEIA